MGEGKRRAARVEGLLRQAQDMHRANRLAEAKDLYRQVIALLPSHAEAWLGLGSLARQVGIADAAIQALSKAVELAPERPDGRRALGLALQDKGRMEEAAEQFQAVCRLRPDDAPSWDQLGIARQSLGDTGAAADAYAQAYRLAPTAGTRIRLATLVSPIVVSREAMESERARLESQLDSLLQDEALAFDDPMHAALWPNFYLAFQGCNNRTLHEKFARLYGRACPSLLHVAPHGAQPRPAGTRIRVGLLSRFFFNHSIGRTSRGLFAQLSREAFEVTAIFVAPVVEDDYSRFIREHAEHSLVIPQDLAEARRLVGALQLDVLFYQDVGMDPFTYFLAFSRLAPVQCVSFGHPDTTGIPAMDYFVSNDLYETPAAPGHYSEKMFLLHGLGTLAHYARPELPATPKGREDFGLRGDDHLYICPQNLFKFHPDMDPLIAGILRGDARAKLVVIEGRLASWTQLMRARWAAAMPDVIERIVFLPRQASQDYVNLIALADVMLDTVHFNGMNTSLEAFSVGTPIVTLPGEFQRGRHTQAMYRRMGISGCIAQSAEDYVAIALRLGTDPGYREEVRQEILARNGVLFEDVEVVREFERFFRETVSARTTGNAR